MKNRLKLQKLLEDILGSHNVYFQPPNGLQLNYPCIIYGLNRLNNVRADNDAYLQHDNYIITVIDKDPESKIIDKISALRLCSFDRHFATDGLYHTTFNIYY